MVVPLQDADFDSGGGGAGGYRFQRNGQNVFNVVGAGNVERSVALRHQVIAYGGDVAGREPAVNDIAAIGNDETHAIAAGVIVVNAVALQGVFHGEEGFANAAGIVVDDDFAVGAELEEVTRADRTAREGFFVPTIPYEVNPFGRIAA